MTLLTLSVLWLSAPTAARATPEVQPVAWATRRAAELTAEAARLVAAGATDEALVLLREAITMDATFGEAYLALADVRASAGDVREAEQVLSMALERVPRFPAAEERRAALRERRGDVRGAATDLDAALIDRPADLALHARVTDTWVRAGEMPRALASARRWAVAATQAGDATSARRAALLAAACVWIVDRADPVTWPEGRAGVRAVLARAVLARAAGPAQRAGHGAGPVR